MMTALLPNLALPNQGNIVSKQKGLGSGAHQHYANVSTKPGSAGETRAGPGGTCAVGGTAQLERCQPPWVGSQLAVRDEGIIVPSGNADGSGRGAWRDGVGTLRRLCDGGELSESVEALDLLVHAGCYISDSLIYRILRRCIAQKDLVHGSRVHVLAILSGFESNAFLANHIICMYASVGRLEQAMQVFTKVAEPNAHMWASIILAHSRHGHPSKAMQLYRQMQESRVKPDNHIFVAILKACAAAKDLAFGKEVHADILESALELNTFVGNCLVDMYMKCGHLEEARRVFDKWPQRNVVTWNVMIAGYALHGLGHEALDLYSIMQDECVSPTNYTFACLLKACASVGSLFKGKELHAQIQDRRLESDIFVGNCLVDMYSKCGSVKDAREVFDRLPTRDVVTWTAMISGYAQYGLGREALTLYSTMQQEGTCAADNFTFACLLQVCSSIGALHEGKQIHAQIQGRGLEADTFVCSCLVNMYTKCGGLEDARAVFDRVPTRNVVTWNAMIAGYVQHGLCQQALDLYATMQDEGVSPTHHTYVCLLNACATVGALCKGKELHAEIEERELEANPFVGNSVVDMYAKCGSLEDARRVLDRLPIRDVVTWNALLNGYAEHSEAQMAMDCFEEMRQQGVEPVDTTFVSLLVACSHAGLVYEGQQYFRTMVEDHGIVPRDHHYNNMVDLLGRSGHLDEAEKLLQSKPFENNEVGWISLLNACKSYGDVERGKRCFDHLINVEPENARSYALLASIYANAGRWSDVDEIEGLRKAAGAKKKPAQACIEVQNKVHEFRVGEERSDISLKPKSLNSRLRQDGGHVPQTELVLKALSERDKEDALCGHAEKLALAYGLLNTPNGRTLLVTKNLRMCNDCHNSTKVMSRIEDRIIIVRDTHRVHRFVNGSCSCRDRH